MALLQIVVVAACMILRTHATSDKYDGVNDVMAFTADWHERGHIFYSESGDIMLGDRLATNEVPVIPFLWFDNKQQYFNYVPTELRDDYGWNNFAINFYGICSPPTTGTWEFKLMCDDGCRFLSDGTTVMNAWKLQATRSYTWSMDLDASKSYSWEINWFEQRGASTIAFYYKNELGYWNLVDQRFCRPGKSASSLGFNKKSYQVLDGTKFSETEEGCQDSEIEIPLPDGYTFAEDNDDTRALVNHYSYGAKCLMVTDGVGGVKYLKTKPDSLDAADRYCSSAETSGVQINYYNDKYVLSGDSSCVVRVLIVSDEEPDTDYAFGAMGVDEDITSIYFKEALFAVVDNGDPAYAPGKGNCSTQLPLRIPDGWTIAPNDGLTKAALIGSAYQFGVNCVFVADGTLINTLTGDVCTGETVATLDTQSLAEYYSLDKCPYGVLMKKTQGTYLGATYTWDESVDTAFELYKTVLHYKGSWYSSMLRTLQSLRTTEECQDKAIELPDGYTIVESGDEGLLQIGAVARYGTSCLLTRDGTGSVPYTGEECGESGSVVVATYDGKVYAASTLCNAAIMIKGAAPPSDPNAKCGKCIAWGDPHFTSLDGKKFDFYGLGEYWVSFPYSDGHPTENDVDWYVRSYQEKVKRASKHSTLVSYHHGNKVVVDVDRGTRAVLPILKIDGQVTSIDENAEITLSGGAKVRRTGNSMFGRRSSRLTYTITMPNGVIVVVRAGFWNLNLLDLELTIPERYRGATLGLCGNCDGDSSNDFKNPDCTTTDINSNKVGVYNWAKQWQVKPNEPLPEGDCAPKDNERETEGDDEGDVDPDPEPCVDASDALKEKAEEACASVHEDLKDGCMLDVCETGDENIGDTTKENENTDKEEITGETEECETPTITQTTASFHGFTYALLDNSNPSSTASGCQTDSYKVPAGWRIARDTPFNRAALSCYPWATECILFSNGKSYSNELKECHTRDLVAEGPDADCYRPASCNSRILLVKLPSENLVANPTFEQDPSNTNKALNWHYLDQTAQTGYVSYEYSTDSKYGRDGEGSIILKSDTTTGTYGAWAEYSGNDDLGSGFKLSVWGKVVSLGGTAAGADNSDVSLYVDVEYVNSEIKGETFVTFLDVTPADWEYKSVNVVLDPSKTVNLIRVFLMFRSAIGEIHFSNLEISNLDAEVFNLLKQGNMNSGHDEWLDLNNAEAYSVDYSGSNGYVEVDRTSSDEEGVSGAGQGVVIANSDMRAAIENRFDSRLTAFFFSGKSEASNFVESESAVGHYYSLYIDVAYADNTNTYGIFEPFSTEASGAQTINRIFEPDSYNVKSLSFNAMVRNLNGKATFDDLYLTTTCSNGATNNPEGGFSYGDPHIKSLDATPDKRGHYDIHAIGEFIFYTDAFVEIQVRHSVAAAASVNSAFHIKTKAVEIQIDRSTGTKPPVLRINGKKSAAIQHSYTFMNEEEQTSTSVQVSGKVGVKTEMTFNIESVTNSTAYGADASQFTTYHHKMSFSVHLADGGDQFMHAFIEPPASLAGEVLGLLGDFDGNPDNDWRVPYQSEPVDTIDEFAEAYRLTPVTSSFVYNRDVDGSSHTNLNFHPKDLSDFSEAELIQAKIDCAKIGAPANVIDSCVFDTLVGGRGYGKAVYTQIANLAPITESLSSIVGTNNAEQYSSATRASIIETVAQAVLVSILYLL